MADPESLTEALQSQVAFYKGEYENLRLETKRLLEENVAMSGQLKSLVGSSCSTGAQAEQAAAAQLMLEDLQQQISLTNKEKESLSVLWQTSQNTIRTLEEELKAYQAYPNISSTQVEDVKREYTSIIKVLESKLKSSCEEVSRGQLLARQLEEQVRTVTEERDMGRTQAEEVRSELSACQNSCQKNNQELEQCRRDVNTFNARETVYRQKVEEALLLVEAALLERDAALQREQQAQEKCRGVSASVSESLCEAARRVQRETDIAKEKYTDKLNSALVHLQRLELQLAEKELALEKTTRECQMLEDEVERCRKSSAHSEQDSRLLVLEQKLEATFQQLVLSERRNIQIVSEKESLQMDYEQLAAGLHRDKQRAQWESKLKQEESHNLRCQLSRLRSALEQSQESVQRTRQQLDLQKETLEENLKQNALNDRWKEGMKEVTEKLVQRLATLRGDNKHLKEQIHNMQHTSQSQG